jgi:hypothetical protein
MTKLEMHGVVSTFVPRLLTQDQRDSRVSICQELLDRASEDENFFKRIITGVETWVYGYDVEWLENIRRDRKMCCGPCRT